MFKILQKFFNMAEIFINAVKKLRSSYDMTSMGQII